MAKPMTQSEQVVGRRLPPEPTYRDTILAGFVRTDDFCGRFPPIDSWLRTPWTRIRKDGLVRASGVRIGFGEGARQSDMIWYLSAKGEIEAPLAVERVRAANEARKQWSRDYLAALQARRGDAAAA